MRFKKYTQDAINGKWHEVKEEQFTEEEWAEFCERWKHNRYSLEEKVAFIFCGGFILFLFILNLWGYLWR